MAQLKGKKKVKKTREELEAQFFPSLVNAGMYISEDNLVPSEYSDDFDIVSLMNEAEDPDTGMIRDLKIDDRDLKSAKNYADYAFNIIGKDANPPWLIQLWTGLMLFSEVCPRCSDKRWLDLGYLIENVPKGTPSSHLLDHIQVLDNGRCPKCKKFKQELIQEFGLRNYQALVNVLGQRSGKSSSAASYSSYLTHRYLKFPKLSSMTNAMQKSTELTGTFVSLTFSKAEALLWTPYMNIIHESSWFCLAEGTPVLLADGTEKPIQEVSAGECVRTFESDSQPVLAVFDNGSKECFEIELTDGRIITATAEHQFSVVRDGTRCWVPLKELTEGDEIVSL